MYSRDTGRDNSRGGGARFRCTARAAAVPRAQRLYKSAGAPPPRPPVGPEQWLQRPSRVAERPSDPQRVRRPSRLLHVHPARRHARQAWLCAQRTRPCNGAPKAFARQMARTKRPKPKALGAPLPRGLGPFCLDVRLEAAGGRPRERFRLARLRRRPRCGPLVRRRLPPWRTAHGERELLRGPAAARGSNGSKAASRAAPRAMAPGEAGARAVELSACVAGARRGGLGSLESRGAHKGRRAER